MAGLLSAAAMQGSRWQGRHGRRCPALHAASPPGAEVCASPPAGWAPRAAKQPSPGPTPARLGPRSPCRAGNKGGAAVPTLQRNASTYCFAGRVGTPPAGETSLLPGQHWHCCLQSIYARLAHPTLPRPKAAAAPTSCRSRPHSPSGRCPAPIRGRRAPAPGSPGSSGDSLSRR